MIIVISIIIMMVFVINRLIFSGVNKGGFDGVCFGVGVCVFVSVVIIGVFEKNIKINLLNRGRYIIYLKL